MNVIDEVNKVCQILNSLDEYDESLSKEWSNNDLAISDLYHYVENNVMNSKSSYRFCKELKAVLKKRRTVKNDMNLLNVYKNNINKLIQKDNRQMLLSEVNQRNKKLQSAIYSNRIYKNGELVELLEK